MLIGPVSLLLLGKAAEGVRASDLLPKLLAAYTQVLTELHEAGAEWVQIDEPYLVTDLDPDYIPVFRDAYRELTQLPVKLMLTTYFGGLVTNLVLAT